VTPGSTGSLTPSTSVAKLVVSPALASRCVLILVKTSQVLIYAIPLESRLGQGSSLQSHSSTLHLEETQHSQPPQIPLISSFFCICYCLPCPRVACMQSTPKYDYGHESRHYIRIIPNAVCCPDEMQSLGQGDNVQHEARVRAGV